MAEVSSLNPADEKTNHRGSSPAILRGFRWELPAFFAAFYVCVWLLIQPHILYHGFGRFTNYHPFQVGWDFLRESLAAPGGLSLYIAGFLSQLYYFSWLGAAVITAMAVGFQQASKKALDLSGWPGARLISYLPPLFFLAIIGSYWHRLDTCTALLVTMWCWVLYASLPLRRDASRAAAFVGIFVFLYWAAASISVLFGISAAAYEAFSRRRVLLGGAVLLLTIAGAWLVGAGFYALSLQGVYLRLSPFSERITGEVEKTPVPRVAVQGLYALFFLLVVVGSIRSRLRRAGSVSKEITSGGGVSGSRLKMVLAAVLRTGAAAAITIFAVYFFMDRRLNRLLSINYFATRQMWPQVLQQARRFPDLPYQYCAAFDIDRALYHTGQLGEKMFNYPQSFEILLLSVRGWDMFSKRCELLTELGYPNIAAKLGYEVLTRHGEYPFILRQLVLINLVRGQTQAARVLLRVLSRDLIYGPRARSTLVSLQQPGSLIAEERIRQLQSLACSEDKARFSTDASEMLNDLLAKNRYNRMAFEYMMALYMLTGRVSDLAENIWRLEDFGYTELPRHYEEALAIYIRSGGERDILGKWVPGPEALAGAAEFQRIYSNVATRSGPAFARSLLARRFGDSYWYYFTFHRRGPKK